MSGKIYPSDQYKLIREVYYGYQYNLSYAVFNNQDMKMRMVREIQSWLPSHSGIFTPRSQWKERQKRQNERPEGDPDSVRNRTPLVWHVQPASLYNAH